MPNRQFQRVSDGPPFDLSGFSKPLDG